MIFPTYIEKQYPKIMEFSTSKDSSTYEFDEKMKELGSVVKCDIVPGNVIISDKHITEFLSLQPRVFNVIGGHQKTNNHYSIDENDSIIQGENLKAMGWMFSNLYKNQFIQAERKTFERLITEYVDHYATRVGSGFLRIDALDLVTHTLFNNARIRVFGKVLAESQPVCDYLETLDPTSYLSNISEISFIEKARTYFNKKRDKVLSKKIKDLVEAELASSGLKSKTLLKEASVIRILKDQGDWIYKDDMSKKTKLLQLIFLYMVLIPPTRILNILVDISAQPDLYSNLIHEQKNIINVFGTSISTRIIKKMKYLDAFIKESLLLSCPASCMHREVQKDVVLSNGTTVQQGSLISINLFSRHHKPEKASRFFRDFDPNKHYSFSKKADGFKNGDMIWGHENKKCPFFKYASAQIKIIVSIMLRKYNIYANVDGFELGHTGYQQIFTVSPSSKTLFLKSFKI